ncbi:lysine--tRNA ligase [Patescibacteria group bacterium]|nr:lysine--tRNA ligase [Patescibacteria group bacterium]MBU4057698.1 lysine--tRNA ligase [Patescibacteria group bacterium]MBU4115641.1 lysine--tRNA ligase [Patescibacteria group bacterium]
MASLEELRSERIKKLKLLREKGIDPYPAVSNRSDIISDVLESFDKFKGKSISVAGRIVALRKHGGSVFFDIFDGSGKIQGFLKQDEVGDEAHKLFDETIDRGDFIEIRGEPYITKSEEKSILIKEWKILTKSLRPIPEDWFGLKDEEERLRKRYLDILLNKDIREMVGKRSIFWNSTREFLLNKGFIEVETPTLEITTGGADAKPFITHHNALDIDVYLRISMGELWQKKLMIAGIEKTFEIGRQFRNEGMDAEHLQDYTQMEFYWAYADYKKGMELVEELYKYIAQKTFGTLKFNIRGQEIDLNKKWERYDYREIVKKFTGIDVLETTIKEVEEKLQELKIEYDKKGFNLNRAIDNLWKYCRKKLVGPGFLVGVPKEVSPLAKSDEREARITQRFQLIIAGSELGNGYSELNDPIDQAERFKKQNDLREAGDQEAQMFDYGFVEALEYGMPPTCGYGMSERLFAFFMDRPIRETQIFPLMKPEEAQENKKTRKQESKKARKQESIKA